MPAMQAITPVLREPVSRRDPIVTFGIAGVAVLFVGWLAVDAVGWISAAFERSAALGTFAAAAMIAGVSGAGAVIAREIASLLRLKNVEGVRRRFSDESLAAAQTRAAVAEVVAVLPRDPETHRAIQSFQRQTTAHHGRPQQIELFSRTVMKPLDQRAEAHVRTAVLRAFGITAISPTALTDAAFFLACGVRMVRGVASSYGHRPTTAATLHLLRRLLLEAGKLGAVDLASASLVQHLGGAVTERFATSTAEALYAAYRMARLGIIVMDLCRPDRISGGRGSKRCVARRGRRPATVRAADCSTARTSACAVDPGAQFATGVSWCAADVMLNWRLYFPLHLDMMKLT